MKKSKKQAGVRIIPLGGLGEVGRNMTLFEYQKKILIVDVGLRMPEEAALGIDYIIPDTSYLEKKKKQILGIVFTHGHYDHIGALPYCIEKFDHRVPMFASALTKGLILKRQTDFPSQKKLEIKTIKDKERIKLGPFEIEFVRLTHSIPDNFALLIKTPIGNIFHTSDFKFDKNPIYDQPTNFRRLEKIGKKGILLLMSDSTGAETEGHSLSEKEIMENLEEIFKKTKGRIIATTFASLINRIHQIIALSEKYGRRVAVDGYSMRANVEITKSLGYLKFQRKTLILPKDIHKYPDSQITFLCTGAQGEDRATLMKIANKEHPFLKLKSGDTVIFSSSVIPGNERTVQILKDNILRQKAKIFHYKMMDIHASGHAKRDELLQMIEIMKPKFFLPIHGQYSMLVAHADLARQAKVPKRRIVVAENGNIVNLTKNKISLSKKEVPSNYVMVDGLGIGDVGEVVLRDRKMLAKDGMFVIVAVVDRQTGRVRGSPDIISRGFVYLRESKELLSETRKRIIKIINKATSGGIVNWAYIKKEIREKIGSFLYSKTQRRPMVLPVIIEI